MGGGRKVLWTESSKPTITEVAYRSAKQITEEWGLWKASVLEIFEIRKSVKRNYKILNNANAVRDFRTLMDIAERAKQKSYETWIKIAKAKIFAAEWASNNVNDLKDRERDDTIKSAVAYCRRLTSEIAKFDDSEAEPLTVSIAKQNHSDAKELWVEAVFPALKTVKGWVACAKNAMDQIPEKGISDARDAAVCAARDAAFCARDYCDYFRKLFPPDGFRKLFPPDNVPDSEAVKYTSINDLLEQIKLGEAQATKLAEANSECKTLQSHWAKICSLFSIQSDRRRLTLSPLELAKRFEDTLAA